MSYGVTSLINALNENGIHVIADRAFDKIAFDFSEHDKKVAEGKDAQIADLEHMRNAWMETAAKWSEENEVLKSQNKDLKDIVENGRLAELEDRHQSDCIEINRLNVALEVMTEKYMKLREAHGL